MDSLVLLSRKSTGGIGQADVLPLRKSRAALDDAGMPGCCSDQAAVAWLLTRRNKPCHHSRQVQSCLGSTINGGRESF
jgi:hypothetical protein